MAELIDVDPREQHRIIEEFFRIGPLVPDKQPTGIELDDAVPVSLPAASTERPAEPLVAQPAAPFRFLHEAPADSVAPFLEREQPQTIAVVISQLAAQRAAEVLAGLPADLQIEVARRLVDLEETDPEILREVEQGLESWLCHQAHGARRRTAGLTALGNILGAASPGAKQRIMANLAVGDRRLAAKLKAPLQPRTFAELEHLDAASLAIVLHHAPPQVIVLALAGAAHEFARRATELFAADEARALREAMHNLGPTRLSDVEESQQQLADIARQLELRGDIAIDARDRLSVAV
jgi:flagellar motor switch protein FliG